MKASCVILGFIIIAIFLCGCSQSSPVNRPPGTCPTPSLTNATEENSTYWVKIDPIPDKHVGERLSIRARTNLPVNETIQIYPYQRDYKPATTKYSPLFYGSDLGGIWQRIVTRVNATETAENIIIINFDTSTLEPSDYCIEFSSMNRSTTTTIPFTVTTWS